MKKARKLYITGEIQKYEQQYKNKTNTNKI